MNTFIFFTKRITDIGGAEQYIYNKSLYLKKNGWRVLIFSGRYGNILVKDFMQYEKLIYPQLRYAPVCYSKKEVNTTIELITKDIGLLDKDLCIIESESVIRALWAEILAERLSCKHFAFPLQEEFDSTEELKVFLKFKYNRHELAGITIWSVNKMFNDQQLERREDTRFSAFCNNVIEECPDVISGLLDPNAKYTIGSLGRLQKPCVLPILDGIKEFVLSNRNDSYNLLLIGGQGDNSRFRDINAKFADLKNVRLVITGDMYPVPKSLVDKVDVFVSTAGSATATYKYGKPTIKVHPVTGVPIGIPGLDFDISEKSIYDTMPNTSIAECMKRILLDKEKIEFNYSLGEDYYRQMFDEFERQLKIESRERKREYYSADQLHKIYPRVRSKLPYRIISVVGNFIGGHLLSKVMDTIGID